MEVDKTTSRFGITLSLRGELDHHAALTVRELIRDAVDEELPGRLVLDLSGVSFMDSSGLGLILGRYTKAVELGIVFKVVNPTPQIRKILDLAGTERLIKIEQY